MVTGYITLWYMVICVISSPTNRTKTSNRNAYFPYSILTVTSLSLKYCTDIGVKPHKCCVAFIEIIVAVAGVRRQR
jgi:hypothetical protein